MNSSGSDGGDLRSCSPRFKVLQTPDFIAELRSELPKATTQILIQLMTFDGDQAGLEIAGLLIDARSRGVDVRLLVDSFTSFRVSDVPVRRPEVAEELASTQAMFTRLRSNGVGLKFTQPLGPANIFAPARNHKKIFVIDDISYLGGINVSDHNFEWHDFMVRITDSDIHAEITADFDHSFEGGRRSTNSHIITNSEIEDVFDALVTEAEHSILLASPYAVDIGLTKLIAKASAPHIQIVASRDNNLPLYEVMSPYLEWRLRRSGAEMLSYASFSHSKFLLVDDSKLLIGSSNFGRHSFWCNQEICLLINDRGFIADFKKALLFDTDPLPPGDPFYMVAAGGVVSYTIHASVFALRRLIAPYVPNLANY